LETKLKDYKVAIVGRKEIALGFRLTGITETYETEDGMEAEKIIRDLMQRNEIGLIIISSQLVRNIKDRKILTAIDSSILPIFMEIPGYKEEKVPDTLRRLIIRAIGIDISSKK
jgi:V/A-type H+/Na+-transporting ATPase subunit F